jgi:hemerythrin-like domain-containing protein
MMAIQAGRTDYSRKNSVDRLHDLLLDFKEQLRIHIEAEEKFIHPLLSKRVPGGARELEEEHRVHFQRVNDLILHLEEVKTKPSSFESLRELGLEYYRALNRFISGYLVHIDKEEEKIQPTLWKLCTEDELMEMVSGFLSRMQTQNPEEAEQMLKIMVPAYDFDELEEIFERAEGAPEEAKRMLYELAERMLSSEEWESVKRRVNEI